MSTKNNTAGFDPEFLKDDEAGKPPKTLAEILKQDQSAAFFLQRAGQNKTVLLTLVEDLPPQEWEALGPNRPLLLDVQEDLLEKLIELKKENDRLQALALVDSLTGLYNNRFFTLQLEKEMARTLRTGLPCSLLMLDLDNFKSVNDSRGHVEGNRFLAASAVTLRDNVRSNDTVCRYGGDEFAVIMPATGLYEASWIANRLIMAVREIADPLELGVSISAGAAEYTAADNWGLQDFVQAADEALYEAKGQGKNRLAVKGRVVIDLDETGMVTIEEKEALFAVKDQLETPGEGNGE
ncbi:MAG TPA: GGDEF domain-containing protein [Thermodesulfobacteriota bacterium]|nr:GGDEF domain-containing protein [Thermodesulfobacteriota bacterium]